MRYDSTGDGLPLADESPPRLRSLDALRQHLPRAFCLGRNISLDRAGFTFFAVTAPPLGTALSVAREASVASDLMPLEPFFL